MEHRTREDLDSALHTFTHPGPKKVEKKEPEVEKELHVRKLHDGSYHHTVSHHPYGERREGSTHDLDEIHDLLEEHFREQKEGEEHDEK